MNIYNLPKTNIKGIKEKVFKSFRVFKNKVLWGAVFLLVAGITVGIFVGAFALQYLPNQAQNFLRYLESPQVVLQKSEGQITPTPVQQYEPVISYEQAIINAVKNSSPSVVSIIISKNLPVYEQRFINPFGPDSPFDFLIPRQVPNGTQYREIGAGSGFIVSPDGLVLTNKHVVLDKEADYTVFTNDGQNYSAKVLALDPIQDLAVIKIELNLPEHAGRIFKPVVFGDSDNLQIGQTAIAIGNALGQFKNTVSVGVVSGLGRTVSASNQTGSFSETLQDIIQTDAAINAGNSGGPLLNLKGEVIGINTAIAQGAQGIGFAIPVNMAKNAIEQVKRTNKIVYPFLGVRYVIIDTHVQGQYNLPVNYGVLIFSGASGEPAVTLGSAAEKAGIRENDIILEMNGQKITPSRTLSGAIIKFKPGDKVVLKILRDKNEMEVEAILGERS